jgi:hypothetical protein
MEPNTTQPERKDRKGSAPRVNVHDGSIEVFLPESASDWQVVVATLDGQGRPRVVARWNPEPGRS